MMRTSRRQFEQLFGAELCLLANPICKECDAQVRHPLLPWLVGRQFSDSDERVLFVGKPHRGEPGQILDSGFIDATALVATTLWHKPWPYWRYTREIAERLYGRNALDFIAMTNLIKCTNVDLKRLGKSASVDRTTFRMAECCISKLGVIWKEIAFLRPRTIIFYTFGLHRSLLEAVPIALGGSIEEWTPQNHLVRCKGKLLGWWERSCNVPWTDHLRILVVGHPERMAKREYVELISNWVRPDRSCGRAAE
jgi:hypothetical protein